jgi:hypothetical protein
VTRRRVAVICAGITALVLLSPAANADPSDDCDTCTHDPQQFSGLDGVKSYLGSAPPPPLAYVPVLPAPPMALIEECCYRFSPDHRHRPPGKSWVPLLVSTLPPEPPQPPWPSMLPPRSVPLLPPQGGPPMRDG